MIPLHAGSSVEHPTMDPITTEATTMDKGTTTAVTMDPITTEGTTMYEGTATMDPRTFLETACKCSCECAISQKMQPNSTNNSTQ